MKKKIAIITPGEYPVPATLGGAVESLVELLILKNETVRDTCIIVYAIYEKHALLKSSDIKNAEFRYWKKNHFFIWEHRLRKLLHLIFKIKINDPYLRFILKNLRNDRVDKIVVEGNISKYVVPIKKIKKDIDVYLHVHHDEFSRKPEPFFKDIFDSCSKIITVSDFVKHPTDDWVIAKNKVVVLKNCIDATCFYNSKSEKQLTRKELGMNKDAVVFLFSGRLIPSKGVKELLLAFKKQEQSNLTLLIAGAPSQGYNKENKFVLELKQIAEECNNKVIFTGFIPYSGMPKIYSATDAVIIPSIENEAAPLSNIEAMAMGLPLITSTSGGTIEYSIEKGRLIVEIDSNFIDNLAKCIAKLAQDNELRNTMGAVNYIHSKQYTSPESFYSSFIHLLYGDNG